MTQAFIFDLDGTLVDSLRGIADSLNRALASHGLPAHPDCDIRSFIGDGARMLVTRAAPLGSSAATIDCLENAFKIDYSETWPSGTAVFPGIIPLLEDLQKQGILMAVLSNKPHPFTCEMVAHLFPNAPFSPVVGHRPEISHKPDPAGALEIATAWGNDPSHCTIIGDSTIDLETAERAGMKAIAVTWGYHDRAQLEQRMPELLVDTIADLRQRIGLS